MSDSAPDIEARLTEITDRLARVEARLGIAPHHATPSASEGAERVGGAETAPKSPTENSLLLGGRALIAVGGAYLLRALAESKIVPMAVGVALGFAYAAVWLWR